MEARIKNIEGTKYLLSLSESMVHTGKHDAIEQAAGTWIRMHMFVGIVDGWFDYEITFDDKTDVTGEEIAEAIEHYDINEEM